MPATEPILTTLRKLIPVVVYVGCDSIKDGELEADNSKMDVEVGDAA